MSFNERKKRRQGGRKGEGGREGHCSFNELGLQVYLGYTQEESFGIYMVGI